MDLMIIIDSVQTPQDKRQHAGNKWFYFNEFQKYFWFQKLTPLLFDKY